MATLIVFAGGFKGSWGCYLYINNFGFSHVIVVEIVVNHHVWFDHGSTQRPNPLFFLFVAFCKKVKSYPIYLKFLIKAAQEKIG